jgi:plasmid segregation protein ParM
MTVLGIDIGYSNLKLACGDPGGEPRVLLRPAGAAPADRLGERIASNGEEDFLRVLVNGEPFVAGLSPDRAELWSRELHEDYPSTTSYRALFHAGLLLAELDQIDRVVTGLPVNQYLNPELRERLAGQMRGEHQITPRRKITVGEVKVVPQPVGGFVDYVWGLPDATEIEDSRVLVVDPGFFSVDWVLISNGELRRQSCGTSLEASSVILDEAVRLIAQDFGGQRRQRTSGAHAPQRTRAGPSSRRAGRNRTLPEEGGRQGRADRHHPLARIPAQGEREC